MSVVRLLSSAMGFLTAGYAAMIVGAYGLLALKRKETRFIHLAKHVAFVGVSALMVVGIAIWFTINGPAWVGFVAAPAYVLKFIGLRFLLAQGKLRREV